MLRSVWRKIRARLASPVATSSSSLSVHERTVSGLISVGTRSRRNSENASNSIPDSSTTTYGSRPEAFCLTADGGQPDLTLKQLQPHFVHDDHFSGTPGSVSLKFSQQDGLHGLVVRDQFFRSAFCSSGMGPFCAWLPPS